MFSFFPHRRCIMPPSGGFRLVVLLAALLLPLAGCAVNPVTGRSELAFYQLSEQQEIALGRKTYPKAIQQMHGYYRDPVLAAYVNRVGERLAAVSHRPRLPYRFTVVNDSIPNAFAMPGGFIAITRGLLVDLGNESQLAAVLGHEIGHVTARHAAQGIQRNLLLNLGLTLLGEATSGSSYSSVARQAGQLASALIASSYSREQEREADRLGIDYMVRAGYNPLGSVQIQEILLRESGERNPLWIEGLFRSHPFSRDRMLANQAYIRSHYPGALANPKARIGAAAFQKATVSLRRTRKAYHLYDQARKLQAGHQLAKAIDLFRRAVTAAPDQALLHSALGLALLADRRLPAARPELEEAVRLDGDYYASRLGLGILLLKAGENQRAVAELERSMEMLPTLNGAFFLAEAYERTGRYRKALELYQEVAKADAGGKLGRAAAARARILAGPF